MKPFLEYLTEQENSEIEAVTEALNSEWTPELEKRVDEAIEEFSNEYLLEDGSWDIERLDHEMTNEGILGSVFGGLTGFALGKTLGKMIAKVLGIKKGSVMYDMLTSRLVGAALGSAIGKKF